MPNIDELELAVDDRIQEIRIEMFKGWALGHDSVEFVAALLRAAYGKGVVDALNDRKGTLEWGNSIGYDLTKQRKGARSGSDS